MRIASRHMPEFRAKPMGFLGWVFPAALGAAVAYLVFTELKASAIVAALLIAGYRAGRANLNTA